MSTETGIVEAVKVTPTQTALLVNGSWYSSYRGTATKGINKGDAVELDWAFDKTGKWKNIKRAVVTLAGAALPASSGGSSYVPKSNIGIELGHASKLAMDVVLQAASAGSLEFGDDQFYKEFVKHTHKIFKIMHKLRTTVEAHPEGAPAPTPAAAKADEPVTVDDEPF